MTEVFYRLARRKAEEHISDGNTQCRHFGCVAVNVETGGVIFAGCNSRDGHAEENCIAGLTGRCLKDGYLRHQAHSTGRSANGQAVPRLRASVAKGSCCAPRLLH